MTLKTGRSIEGHPNKKVKKKPFSIVNKFRTHSHDIASTYDIEDHEDLEELKDTNLSPKQVDDRERLTKKTTRGNHLRTTSGNLP